MPDKVINRDYIGVVKEIDGRVSYDAIEIPHPHTEFLEQISDMVNNANRTVFDLQSHFDLWFKESPARFNYTLGYSDSYVEGICKPKDITNDEYQDKISKPEENRVSYKANESYEEALNRKLKEYYLQDCQYYIRVLDYYDKYKSLKEDPTIKMISTSFIGWTNIPYKITSEISADMSTNFGYGVSSYFILILKYKDIKIIPYSHLVKYPKAQAADLIRNTRSYKTDSDSWEPCLKFTARAAELAKQGPDVFFDEFLVREIDEMMSGLRRVHQSAEAEVEHFINFRNPQNPYIYVREFSSEEKNEYNVYKKEFVLMFKVEKLAGALDFLEELGKISDCYDKIDGYIEEIKQINRTLIPEIDAFLVELSKEIEAKKIKSVELQEEIDVKDAEVERLDELMAPYEDELDSLKKKAVDEFGTQKKAEHKDEDWDDIKHQFRGREISLEREVKEQYISQHPQFVELQNERSQISNERSGLYNKKRDLDKDIRYRENIVKALEDNKEKIKTATK